MNEANLEKLGGNVDSLQNILAATTIPMPAEFHLTQLKEIIPEIIESLKEVYKEESGENPWEDN